MLATITPPCHSQSAVSLSTVQFNPPVATSFQPVSVKIDGKGKQDSSIASVWSVVDVANVPESFLRALADFNSRRVIDADKALSEPPPEM
jgi:hypothetical protein